MSNHRNREDEIKNLEKRKLEKEIEKIEKETRQLTWYRNPNILTPILVTILTAFLAFAGYFITGADKLLEIKRERIEYREEKLKDTIGMIDKRFSQLKEDTLKMHLIADSLIAKNENLLTSNHLLAIENERELSKIQNLSEESAKAQTQLQVKTKELDQSKVSYFFPIIDSIRIDFTPSHPVYGQLKHNLKLINKVEGERLILEYAKDTSKLLSSRFAVLAALYESERDLKVWKVFLNLLDENILEFLQFNKSQFSNIEPVLYNKAWSKREYHEIAKLMVRKLLASNNMKGKKLSQVTKFISRDYGLDVNQNELLFLDYIKLYRYYCQNEERSSKVYNEYFESSIFPKIATQIFWYDLVVNNKLPKSQFPAFNFDWEHSTLLGINKKDISSVDYWKLWAGKHTQIIERIFEPDLHSYKKSPQLLRDDMISR